MPWSDYPLRSLTLPGDAGPSTPRLVLGPDIPTILSTFYAPNTVTAVELAYSTATNYHYTAWMFVPATNQTLRAEGWVLGGATVLESFAQYLDPTGGGGNQRQLFFGDAFGILANSIIYNFSGPSGGSLDPTATPYGALNLDPVNPVDFTIDGVSQSRGIRNFTSSTASSGAIAGETVVLTLGSAVTFRKQRAYEIIHHTNAAGSVALNWALYTIRRGTTTAGTILDQRGYVMAPTVGFTVNASTRIVCKNVTGADISTQICATLTGNFSGGTCTDVGSATQLRSLEVRDLGYAADYPNAIQI